METSERTIDAITAVKKFAIWNPGTTKLTPQSKTTLMRNAVIPKVRIERGIKIICKTGLINVLTTPMTTAAITVAQRFSNSKPGTRYETTRRVKTFRDRVIRSFICYMMVRLLMLCQY